MTISRTQKIAGTILGTLVIIALGAMIATASWGNASERLRKMSAEARTHGAAVDTRPLDAAQQLAQLAETRTEKAYAAEALRLGDYSVDFAFAAAIREAANAPAPRDSASREIIARVKVADAAVAADSAKVADFTAQLAKANGSSHDNLQQQLDLATAQRELDQDEADDAHQDLIRAGGDKLASVQRLRAQHDTSEHAAAAPNASANTAAAAPVAPSIELTKNHNTLDLVQAWLSLDSKRALLEETRQNTIDRTARLSDAHDTLEKQVAAEKAGQQILHAKGRNASNVALAKPAADAKRVAVPKVDTAPTPVHDSTAPASALSFLQDLTVDQKDLSELDKRIENEQDLATLYGNWINYVQLRQQSFVHSIIVSAFWVLLIALFIVGANEAVRRVFSETALQRRQLHTVRTVLLFAVQGGGIIVILLLLFGMPSNFATVVALAGAGMALALQDFIVGFFGWFILMGKDGIRPGDWVEINGVGGEVLEVGVFQTVLLETSNWSESADPTGRKVSFVNSFAIEGHYFNFSTSGQWLWDELEITVTDGSDPYAVAEEIQRLAASETDANADEAEKEWRRVVPSRVRQVFSAVPSVRVRPSNGGVSVVVRYLTRASERQAVRAKMYRAMIELLGAKKKELGAGS